MAQAQYSYNPPAQEQAYYDALFTAADKSSSGYLSGSEAVEFLSLSKLPVDLLKTIWSMADQNPTTNTLDKSKFCVAVRLIQLFQNGKKPIDLELNLSPEESAAVRPPFFEGVVLNNNNTNTSAPPPPQTVQPPQQSPQPSPSLQPQQPQQPAVSPLRPTNSISMTNNYQNGLSTPSTIGTNMSHIPPSTTTTALTTTDPYNMTPSEQSRYTALFPTYATIEPNYVHGAQAVELFLKSGMDREQLKLIWTMCDDEPVDNKLDVVEFAIAMHLIVCVTKKGLGLPPCLPPSLVGLRRESRAGQQPPQPQQQAPPPQQQQQQGQVNNMMGGGSVMGGMSTMQQQNGTEGGIPSPDKVMQNGGTGGGMTMMPPPAAVEQPQMNGGMAPPPSQMGMMQQQQQQPPVLSMGMQQPQPSPTGQQQVDSSMPNMMTNGHAGGGGFTNGFGNGFGSTGALGGETVDDAFAGLPNDPVEDVDAYSAIGGPASVVAAAAPATLTTAVVEEPAPAVAPAMMSPPEPSPVLQSMAPPTSSPNMAPVSVPTIQPQIPAPAPAAVTSSAMPSPPTKPVVIPNNAQSELEELKAAHQKLQAEAVSLRAKAGLVTEEEQQAQAEIAKVASEIATLSSELEGLRTQVTEAQIKLTDAVATLKSQMEKKGSLELAVQESRETVEALEKATDALVEANEGLVVQQAKAVADAAAAKEEAEAAANAVPEPSADLFSWDSPAKVVPEEQQPLAPPAGMQGMGAPWGEQPGQLVASESEPAPIVAAPTPVMDAGSVYSSASELQMSSAWGVVPQQQQQQQPVPVQVADAGSVYSTNSRNQRADSGVWSAGGMGAPQPMMQQPQLQQQMMMAPTMSPPAPQPVQQQLPTIESPTAGQIEQMKNDALVAEKSFRASQDLVKTLAKEVKHLEAMAQKAEEDKKAIESKKKKMGGKKKQKKEIEKAHEFAMGEQKKVMEARQQLDAAKRQANAAQVEADKLRQQYEEAEVEAATAASYLSVNASQSMAATSVGPGSVAPQQQYQQQQYQQPQYQQPAPSNDMFSDTFGMGGGMGAQQAASDPYGMGLMGGSADGDYSNPFAM